MNNTSSDHVSADEISFEIRPAAYTALNNPMVRGSDFWNLNGNSAGSASFRAAWAYATGTAVKVGIVDEGVNYRHKDLADNYSTKLDFDPRDSAGNFDALSDSSSQTHGTEVAGIIAGSAKNTLGTVGAAPDAIIAASYLRYGATSQIGDIAEVLDQQFRFDVSNNSWGFTSAFADNFQNDAFDSIASALGKAADQGRGGLGTSVVFAAGNGKVNIDGQNFGDDSNFHSLTNSRFVIAVGAHDEDGRSAFFSSPGSNVLLSAPGVSLLTVTGNGKGADAEKYVSGTSFAAPMVSSAIALMLEVNPNLGYRDVQEILAISSEASLTGTVNGAGNVNGGGMLFDREMGFGSLDALAAVSLARTWAGQSTAKNEGSVHAQFVVPSQADASSQSLTVEVASPDGSGFSLDHAELSLSVVDSDLKDLRIELTSAAGTKILIAPNLMAAIGRTELAFNFSTVAAWGENPYGTWTVTFSHPAAGGTFEIREAALTFYGDVQGNDDTYFFTSSFDRLVAHDPSRATTSDTDGGTDTLNFAAAGKSVYLDLAAGTAQMGASPVTLMGAFENATGTVHNDQLNGSDTGNILIGDFGNDRLDGRGGDDLLLGGDGKDTLFGGLGSNSLTGGNGNDLYVVEAMADRIVETKAGGADAVRAAVDFSLVSHIEKLTLTGAAQIGTGNAGDNTIGGNGVANTLRGLAGDDTLKGGLGDDQLDGGRGSDELFGGKGKDTFVFRDVKDSRGRDVDVIKDFHRGQDVIDLSAFDTNARKEGDNAFKFIGDDKFGKHAGELRFDHSGKATIVTGDVNGDGRADFAIELSGHVKLTGHDFFL